MNTTDDTRCDCGAATDLRLEDTDEPTCLACARSAMEHGHQHVHDEPEDCTLALVAADGTRVAITCADPCVSGPAGFYDDPPTTEEDGAGPEVCNACDYVGYSPSGFVVLSHGEVECPECDGAGGHYHEDGEEDVCTTCNGGGTVPCEHEACEHCGGPVNERWHNCLAYEDGVRIA